MRKTIIMILVAAALATYVYFYEIKGGEKREQAKAASEKILALEKDSINVVKIKSMFSEFEFQKDSDGWRILNPIQTGAEEAMLNTFLSGLVNAKKERSFAVAKEEQSNFGLDQRALKVELKSTNSKQVNMLFGEATSIGSNVYVTTGDSMVHLVASSVKNNAQKTLFDWRDKKALHFEKSEVREIHITDGSGQIFLIKEGEDWKIQKPLNALADKKTVDGLLDKLDLGKITSVVSESADELKKYINRNTLKIELLIGADKVQKEIILSGLSGNTAYGKDGSRPHIFQVDSSFMKPLNKTLFDFQDKSIISFEQNQSTRILYESEGLKVELNKDENGTWYGADSAKAKSWKVTSLLSNIAGLEAIGFKVPAANNNFSNPDGLIKVFSDSEIIAEISFIKKNDEVAYVYNSNSGLKAKVKTENMEGLFPEPADIFEEVKQEETN